LRSGGPVTSRDRRRRRGEYHVRGMLLQLTRLRAPLSRKDRLRRSFPARRRVADMRAQQKRRGPEQFGEGGREETLTWAIGEEATEGPGALIIGRGKEKLPSPIPQKGVLSLRNRTCSEKKAQQSPAGRRQRKRKNPNCGLACGKRKRGRRGKRHKSTAYLTSERMRGRREINRSRMKGNGALTEERAGGHGETYCRVARVQNASSGRGRKEGAQTHIAVQTTLPSEGGGLGGSR